MQKLFINKLKDKIISKIKVHFLFQKRSPFLSLFAISACGSEQSDQNGIATFQGLKEGYQPPESNYLSPHSKDPYYEILKTQYEYPYWIKALEMDHAQGEITSLLDSHDNTLEFSFPNFEPTYEFVSAPGWRPASEQIKISSRKIFTDLSEILGIKIEENSLSGGFNNIAISQSIQHTTAGISYFPNNFYEIGSDIFMSTDYGNPIYLNELLTNYDYEVLIHEIGHALGLKHPFEGDGANTTVLSDHEDSTFFTLMSYDDDPSTFDGAFRSLDLMALAKFYGVNNEYHPGSDTYNFSDFSGTFIVDGGGIDVISTKDADVGAYIDLRPGTHSYLGVKSIYISDENQLTISHGSNIENIITGSGNDYVIGNDLVNEITTNSGNDQIFSGEGGDIVNSGKGNDVIDLSELSQSIDTVIIDNENIGTNFDLIYGFVQGVSGDEFDINALSAYPMQLLPVISADNVPEGFLSNHIIRVVDISFSDPKNVAGEFSSSGSFSNLKIVNEEPILIISANSQDTGEMQMIYLLHNVQGSYQSDLLVVLEGNYLDIDLWSASNFYHSNAEIIA